jgi:hypothetical protein
MRATVSRRRRGRALQVQQDVGRDIAGIGCQKQSALPPVDRPRQRKMVAGQVSAIRNGQSRTMTRAGTVSWPKYDLTRRAHHALRHDVRGRGRSAIRRAGTVGGPAVAAPVRRAWWSSAVASPMSSPPGAGDPRPKKHRPRQRQPKPPAVRRRGRAPRQATAVVSASTPRLSVDLKFGQPGGHGGRTDLGVGEDLRVAARTHLRAPQASRTHSTASRMSISPGSGRPRPGVYQG